MYQPQNVILTGGCGFIGSNVLNYLSGKYPNVTFINIDRVDYCSSVHNVDDNPNVIFIKEDLRHINLLEVMEKYDVDTIMHFAAQTHVDNSFFNAQLFIEDNVIATVNILKNVATYGKIKRFIHVSTDEVYGESTLDEAGNTEYQHLNPTNPYSASKASAEYFVKSFSKCFNIPFIITRGNNVYGPRQYPEKLFPKFITKLLNCEKCPIHGKGNNLRNFIYVDDVSRAFETILLHGKLGEIYNIGGLDEFSVLEVTKLLIKKMKPNEKISDHIIFIGDRPWNDGRYAINSDKLIDLGWKVETSFEDGVNKTINWYENISKDYWK